MNKIYDYLIKKGKKIKKIPKKYKKKKLKNCLTKIWIFTYYKNKKIFFIGYSKSNIINGIIYLIKKDYSNKTPYEIINKKKNFIKKINLKKYLTINRYFGILNIIKYIKNFAFKLIKK
ncbi:MAG: SufE family protein [Candidatus Shikimatogenerans sp. JK-2022]|nr:SufE family protein [Candidatus Shikimatogenerans bostrichidophilus]